MPQSDEVPKINFRFLERDADTGVVPQHNIYQNALRVSITAWWTEHFPGCAQVFSIKEESSCRKDLPCIATSVFWMALLLSMEFLLDCFGKTPDVAGREFCRVEPLVTRY